MATQTGTGPGSFPGARRHAVRWVAGVMLAAAALMCSGGEGRAFVASAAGYACVDSKEEAPDAPMYAWDDITQGGNQIWLGDEGFGQILLEWPASVVTASDPWITVHSNGFAVVGWQWLDWMWGWPNEPVPSWNPADNAWFPFWDDLAPQLVYWQILGSQPNRRLVVSWVDVPHAFGGDYATVSFQMTLYEAAGGSCVRFQYGGMTGVAGGGQDATVGIENFFGGSVNGIEYVFNGFPEENQVFEGLAIGFHPTNQPPQWTVRPQEVEDPGSEEPAPGGSGAVQGRTERRDSERCSGSAGAGTGGLAALLAGAALILGLSVGARRV